MATDEHGGDLPYEQGTATIYPGLGCPHCPAAFGGTDAPKRQSAHIDERHVGQPSAKAWVHGGHQISYVPGLNKQSPHAWSLSDLKTQTPLSQMILDNDGRMLSIETHPKHRRKGHATKLWESATQLSDPKKGMPVPKHSASRTPLGDKFSKSVGGDLPKRSPVSAAQFRGFRWD